MEIHPVIQIVITVQDPDPFLQKEANTKAKGLEANQNIKGIKDNQNIKNIEANQNIKGTEAKKEAIKEVEVDHQ